MSSVKIYFTLLDGAAAVKEATKVLNHAAGFLRHALRERVVLRAIPELRFYYDESVARGAHLTSLIDQAIAEDKEHPHDE